MMEERDFLEQASNGHNCRSREQMKWESLFRNRLKVKIGMNFIARTWKTLKMRPSKRNNSLIELCLSSRNQLKNKLRKIIGILCCSKLKIKPAESKGILCFITTIKPGIIPLLTLSNITLTILTSLRKFKTKHLIKCIDSITNYFAFNFIFIHSFMN